MHKNTIFILVSLLGIATAGIVFFSISNTTSPKSSSFEINDLVDSYKVGDTVKISVTYDGKVFDCKFPKILVTNATNSSQIIVDTGGEQNNTECPDHYYVEFFAGMEGYEPITYTQSYLATISLGGNTLQKTFNVNPDPSRKFYTDIQINDLENTYTSGIPIDFTVTVRGFGVFDAGPMPEVFVEDSNGNLIWSYQNNLVLCCPVGLEELNKELQISRFGDPLVIEKSDTYTVHVTYNHKIIEKKFTVIDSSPKTIETPESLLVQFEILANENTKLQDQITLIMQELESARANKSDAVSSLEAELDVINKKLKQNGIKLDQIRTATSKFYEIDSQLKATLEKAQQILTDNHNLIPWNGLGIDPKSRTLWIEFESSYLADKYTPVIKKLIGDDIPITVFVGKNTFD